MKITKNDIEILNVDQEKIWHDIEAFASYAFNKSHAIAYSVLSYFTAYLMANKRDEFLTYIVNESPRQKDNVLRYCKDNGYSFIYPSIFNNVDREDYYIKEGRVYIPSVKHRAYETFGDFLADNEISKMEIVYQGACDKICKDRRGINEMLKYTSRFSEKLKDCSTLMEVLNLGVEEGIWSFTQDSREINIKLGLRPRERVQKEFKIMTELDNEARTFNFKKDLSYFGSPKANSVDEIPRLPIQICQDHAKKIVDHFRKDDGTFTAMRTEIVNKIKKYTREILNHPKVTNKIDWSDKTFIVGFEGMTISSNYGTAKISLSFDGNPGFIFWERNSKIINQFNKLNKNSVCEIQLGYDWYVDKDLVPQFNYKILGIVEKKEQKQKEEKRELTKEEKIEQFLRGE